MKSLLNQILPLTLALPLACFSALPAQAAQVSHLTTATLTTNTGPANPTATPHPAKKAPLNGVYVSLLHAKPGQLSFRVSGHFLKSYNETWVAAEDPMVKGAILGAFLQHKRIDITDYSAPGDKKSKVLVAKEITLRP